MLVGELILRRKNLKVKISELQDRIEKRGCVDKEEYDNTISELFDMISELQTFSIILNRINNKTMIKFVDKSINVSDAVEVRNAIKNKINVFSGLINKTPEQKFSSLTLFKQRDELMDEYLYIVKIISISDWSTEIDQ
jgi:hypothetical protein